MPLPETSSAPPLLDRVRAAGQSGESDLHSNV
jgi:hypothetical protein